MIDLIKDPEGKKYLGSYLENKGLVVEESTDFWSRWDLRATMNGITYYFEIKVRPIVSTAYNDSIIQMDKLQALKSYENDTTQCFVVNFFTDCFYIVSIDDDYNVQNHMAQKTNYDKSNKVPKQLVSYPHTRKNRREYSKRDQYEEK